MNRRMSLGRLVTAILKGGRYKEAIFLKIGCNVTKVFPWRLQRAMRAREAHRSCALLALRQHLHFRRMPRSTHTFEGDYRTSIMVCSHPMNFSVRGTSPDPPAQRDGAGLRHHAAWPTVADTGTEVPGRDRGTRRK
jgi:hypothetical protein